MLIRISGGTEGIKEYLENGQKHGREKTRDELDNRMILDGDLESTNEIIRSMETDAERYLHITLAFKEDDIEQSTLEAVVQEFKDFAFTSYTPDEYSFYAEAHMPKIKSYINRQSGEFVERKPHIHIVIPKINLLTGQHLNPFGMVEQNQIFIDAFQEHLNNKYGLASPKDNRRIRSTGESEMISRYKGDIFEGPGQDIKAEILETLLAKRVDNYEIFKTMLSTYGKTRSPHEGKANEYQNLKPIGASKGMNLKEYVFSREFIELPDLEKRTRLTAVLQRKYEMVGPARKTSAELAATLKEWHEVRARELKYINSGNKKVYEGYREASQEERLTILSTREKWFYTKYREGNSNERQNSTTNRFTKEYGFKSTGQNFDGDTASAWNWKPNADAARSITQAQSLNRVRDLSSVSMVSFDQGREVLLQDHESDYLEHEGTQRINSLRRDYVSGKRLRSTGRSTDTFASQLLRDLRERKQILAAEVQPTIAVVKKHLEANRLLADLSRSHGVLPSKYEVTKAKDGSDRIKCGTRNLNVSDFLTRELNLPWMDAEKILRASYQQQLGNEPQQLPRHEPRKELWANYQVHRKAAAKARSEQLKALSQQKKDRLKAIKNVFYAKRSQAQSSGLLKPAERKAAISIARMERIEQEQAQKELHKEKSGKIKAEQNKPFTEQYRDYLVEQAQEGNEAALDELRRMKTEPTEKEAANTLYIIPAEQQSNRTQPISRSISYQVHRNGDVTYKRNGLEVLRDQGQRVQMLQTDEQSIETGLRLAQQKFGSKLTLSGSQEFQERTARVAAELGLRVEFTDQAIQKVLLQRKAEIAVLKSFEGNPEKAGLNNDGAVIQESLVELERLAGAGGYKTEQANGKYYYGTVLAITEHHFLHQVKIGAPCIVHEIGKLRLDQEKNQALRVGDKVVIDYRKSSPQLKVITIGQDKHIVKSR